MLCVVLGPAVCVLLTVVVAGAVAVEFVVGVVLCVVGGALGAGAACCTTAVAAGVVVGVAVAPVPESAIATPAKRNARPKPAVAPSARTSCRVDNFVPACMFVFPL